MDKIEIQTVNKNIHLIKTAISLIDFSFNNENKNDFFKNINILDNFLNEIKILTNYSDFEKYKNKEKQEFIHSLHSKIAELESLLAKENDIKSSSVTFKNFCDTTYQSLYFLGFTKITMLSNGFINIELSLNIPEKANSDYVKNEDELNKKQENIDKNINYLKSIFEYDSDNFSSFSIIYNEKNKETLINEIQNKIGFEINNIKFYLKNFETNFIDKIEFNIETTLNQYKNMFIGI